jgi:hypothetical protein
MKVFLVPLAVLSVPAWAYDANGVKLGASESEVRKAFPTAHCKPLEWSTAAADRRCDDVKASFGGIAGRITFYLKRDALQAFDVRFDTSELARMTKVLKERYGAPASETRDSYSSKDGKEIYKALWQSGKDRATLVSQVDKRRSQLTVSRGNFEEEVYRVR